MRVRKLSIYISAALLVVAFIVSLIVGGGAVFVRATSAYSDVMTDLQQDSAFKLENYYGSASDYSLQVIQIAESTDGEVFIYVYNPSGYSKPLTATSLNLALTEEPTGTRLYDLVLLSREGLFGKYLVNGISVSSDKVRYYNITSIYRAFDSDIDEGTGNASTKDEVSYAVGKAYCATTENGKVIYDCKALSVVEIINPYAGFIRYSEGVLFWKESCDSHYVAFSTNYEIEKLFEAEVYYKPVSVMHTYGNITDVHNYYRTELDPDTVALYSTKEHVTGAWGFGGIKHTWKEIENVDEFISRESLSEEVKSELQGKQWVLRFKDTDYTKTNAMGGYEEFYTEMSEVSVLRLKFETKGVVYNLGAVSDKLTEDKTPSNPTDDGFNFWRWLWEHIKNMAWWQLLLIGFGIVVAIVLVVSVIKWGIKVVITAPFRFIAWIFRKIRGSD